MRPGESVRELPVRIGAAERLRAWQRLVTRQSGARRSVLRQFRAVLDNGGNAERRPVWRACDLIDGRLQRVGEGDASFIHLVRREDVRLRDAIYLRLLNQVASVAGEEATGTGADLGLERVIVVIVCGDEHGIARAETMVELQAEGVVEFGAGFVECVVVARKNTERRRNVGTRIEVQKRHSGGAPAILRNNV